VSPWPSWRIAATRNLAVFAIVGRILGLGAAKAIKPYPQRSAERCTDRKRRLTTMHTLTRFIPSALLLFCLGAQTVTAADTLDAIDDTRFQAIDIFQLEWASDPQISRDGKHIVYVRHFMDIDQDRRLSNLWWVDADGSHHRPLTSGDHHVGSPRFSPDGSRLVYRSDVDGKVQLYLRYLDTGQVAPLTRLRHSPGEISWSPDGSQIAFTMQVLEKPATHAKLPSPPEGASWAKPPRYIDTLLYRVDGAGYLKDSYTQIFVLPADGGTPRQVTHGAFNHQGTPIWSRDGKSLLISANRHENWRYEPLDSEIYRLDVASGKLTALTDRYGPDQSPRLSPDGKHIAYLGFDDHHQGYQLTRLYLMDANGKSKRLLSAGLDRSLVNPRWDANNRGLYVQYDDQGDTKVAFIDLHGKIRQRLHGLGGTTIGRPYSGGSYSLAGDGHIAYTLSRSDRPADIGLSDSAGRSRRLTDINADLLDHKRLGKVEAIRFASSFDQLRIHGWLLNSPDFDAGKQYPLILEIHGGPFANYGDRFSAEMQLYAAAGYAVLFINPRGSTSYGAKFGNLIHHDYPNHDFDDLMSGVDAVLAKGFVDKSRLYVTGGSGGGVLSSWIVGHTSRFRAAVVVKPVINWTSFVLTADFSNFFNHYWFSGFPWDKPEEYRRRSPLTFAGKVTTPTLLMTGESDFRTPSSEAEQFYQALKLRKIDAAMVRIPGASHHIAERPSQLIAKVAHILSWFERHAPNTESVDQP